MANFQKIHYSLLVLFITLFGCLSTHQITHNQSGYVQMNIRLNGERGIITLHNNEEYVGYEIIIGADSTTGVEIKRSTGKESDRNQWQIPTSDIKMIEIKDHLRGGSIGFGVGFALGALAGAFLGAAAAEMDDKEAEFGHYLAGAGIVGLVGGVVFGLPAVIIGYKDKYVFTHAGQEK